MQTSRGVAIWLLVTWAMIGLMVAVGGATRLTGSGLSMVDWSVEGQAPPTTDADWQRLWEEYRSSPQFLQVNHWMTRDDFRGIFWWEYIHRQLGRLIGVVYGLPFLWFFFRKRLPGSLGWRGWVALLLGGTQGLVGWWMVKSGLVDRPEVSHYRLAVHLSLALFLGMWVFSMWLDARRSRSGGTEGVGSGLAVGFLVALSLQVVWGAFVAGKKAGWRYDSWPDMDGRFLPEGAFATATSAIDDGDTIHWIHRTWAYVVVALGVLLWRRLASLAPGPARALLVMLVAQFALGVVTVMMNIPVALGVAHQLGAFFLLTAATWSLWATRTTRVVA